MYNGEKKLGHAYTNPTYLWYVDNIMSGVIGNKQDASEIQRADHLMSFKDPWLHKFWCYMEGRKEVVNFPVA
jgi:hypothetical protein